MQVFIQQPMNLHFFPLQNFTSNNIPIFTTKERKMRGLHFPPLIIYYLIQNCRQYTPFKTSKLCTHATENLEYIVAAFIDLRKKPYSFPHSQPLWQILIDHQSCSPFPSLYLAIKGHLIMQSLQLPSICWEIEYPTRM